jgi:hypothetical protein
MNKIFEIEAEIAGVAGSYAQNRQRKYQEFYIEDWTTTYLLLESFARQNVDKTQ